MVFANPGDYAGRILPVVRECLSWPQAAQILTEVTGVQVRRACTYYTACYMYNMTWSVGCTPLHASGAHARSVHACKSKAWLGVCLTDLACWHACRYTQVSDEAYKSLPFPAAGAPCGRIGYSNPTCTLLFGGWPGQKGGNMHCASRELCGAEQMG